MKLYLRNRTGIIRGYVLERDGFKVGDKLNYLKVYPLFCETQTETEPCSLVSGSSVSLEDKKQAKHIN